MSTQIHLLVDTLTCAGTGRELAMNKGILGTDTFLMTFSSLPQFSKHFSWDQETELIVDKATGQHIAKIPVKMNVFPLSGELGIPWSIVWLSHQENAWPVGQYLQPGLWA